MDLFAHRAGELAEIFALKVIAVTAFTGVGGFLVWFFGNDDIRSWLLAINATWALVWYRKNRKFKADGCELRTWKEVLYHVFDRNPVEIGLIAIILCVVVPGAVTITLHTLQRIINISLRAWG